MNARGSSIDFYDIFKKLFSTFYIKMFAVTWFLVLFIMLKKKKKKILKLLKEVFNIRHDKVSKLLGDVNKNNALFIALEYFFKSIKLFWFG